LSNKNRFSDYKNIESDICYSESNSYCENPLIGIYETNRNGDLLFMNQKLIEMLGYSNFHDIASINFFNGELSEKADRIDILKNLRYNSFVRNKDEWKGADNSKVHVNEFIKKTKSGSGDIIYQGFVEDISALIKTEIELTETKFEVEQSEKFKAAFLTQISHEIRTPINTLLNYISLVKSELDEKVADSISNYFTSIESAGKRIVRTIDLLVKISELVSNNYKGKFDEHDLSELLREIVSNYRLEAEQKNINLKIINQLNESKFLFDRSSVYDIFDNLIDNAVKYTSAGGVTVYLKLSILSKISVVIKDTGEGITTDYLNKIFRPFSQETDGYTRRFDGNGLGLSLVKEYCRLNNAEIFVCSEKGVGSEFTVIFN
jgi:signal transduction histidine kinase